MFSAASEHAMPSAISEEYRRRGIRIESEAEFWERHLRRVDITNLDSGWFQALGQKPVGRWTVVIGRAFDILASLGLLFATFAAHGHRFALLGPTRQSWGRFSTGRKRVRAGRQAVLRC